MSPVSKSDRKASLGTAKKSPRGFTDEEKAAMKEYIKERSSETLSASEGEAMVLSKIAEMKGSDRVIGGKLHSIIKETAPGLTPRTWYGMPAYSKEGKVVCFFQPALKFKSRYATLGFSDSAKLDEGDMWPTVYALKTLGGAEEAKVRALLKKAVD